MAFFQPKTLNMVSGTGYVISFDTQISVASVIARAECYIQPIAKPSTPATPTAAFIPGAGAQTNTLHMLANETQVIGVDPLIGGTVTQISDTFNYLLVWAVGSGILTVSENY